MVPIWVPRGIRWHGASVGDDGGWGLAGRLTFLPYDCESTAQLLHVGFDYALIAPPDDTVRFGAIPEAFLAEEGVGRIPNFVDTGIITAENVNQFGVEGAFQNGRLHGQSELFVTIVDQIGGGNSYFHGAYSQVVYSLTGEARPYDRKSGTFGRPNPHHALDCGGLGAWEMAARWS